MLHLADHAAHLGGVAKLDRLVHLAQAEALERRKLILAAADRRPGLGHLHRRGCFLLRHVGLLRDGRGVSLRSEEHTSELQSLMRISYAVFCLKKKNTNKN